MSMVEITYRPIPPHGDHMPSDEFEAAVRRGSFNEMDGHARYATRTQMVSKTVCLGSIRAGFGTDKRFSHVVWFAK